MLTSATVIDLALGAGTLLVTLGIGTVVHEYAHAVVLRAIGASCRISWLPGRDAPSTDRAAFFGRWATVTLLSIPRGVSPWGLRLAALAPFALATPVALIPLGVLPDPTAWGNLPLVMATIAWLGCALPSPQDFSLFWHAEQAIDGAQRPDA